MTKSTLREQKAQVVKLQAPEMSCDFYLALLSVHRRSCDLDVTGGNVWQVKGKGQILWQGEKRELGPWASLLAQHWGGRTIRRCQLRCPGPIDGWGPGKESSRIRGLQPVAALPGGQLSLMRLFINTGSSASSRQLWPFVCLSSWALLSARLQEADINIFISLTFGGQVGLLQMTSPWS